MQQKNKKSSKLLKAFFFLSAFLVLGCLDVNKPESSSETGGSEATKYYAVTFEVNGGSFIFNARVKQGERLKKPGDPTKSEHTFGGWYTDRELKNVFDFNTPITGDNLTLYAKWEIIYYTVTFEANGGSSVSSQEVASGSRVLQPTAPTRSGYLFKGWFTTAEAKVVFNFNTAITNDLTVYAKWIKLHTVTFNTGGGSAVASQTITNGDKAKQPPDPNWTGRTFNGWFTTAEAKVVFNFNTAITNDLTVYAAWELKSYSVTFITNVGNPNFAVQTIKHGSNAVKPSTNPTRSGYLFKGWYTDAAFNNAFNLNTKITAALTLYAKWERIYYTVTFEANGGSSVTSQRVEHGSRATKPSNPTRSGYVFKGWYTDSGLNNAFSFSAAITANRTLYAKWKVTGDFNTLSAAGNNRPNGIWSDGTTMWVADGYYGDKKIYAYRMSDKTRDPNKDLNTLSAAGNTTPYGTWSDGNTMWVANYGGRIYAYRMSDKQRDSAKDFNTLYAAGNTSPYGIWSDGTTMWVADWSDDKIYAYNLSTKARDPAKDFNTLYAAGNTSPYGIWSDGTTMWVADGSWTDGNNDKIYAYRMSDKARDSAKDFNTLSAAGNDNPYGIWSDGTTMWVTDGDDNKIYAYSLRTKQRTP